MTWLEHTPILIVIIPLFCSFLIPVFHKLSKKVAPGLAIAGTLGSLIFSAILAYAVYTTGKIVVYTLGAPSPLVTYGQLKFPVRILLEVDKFSAFMSVLVAFEAFIAAIYSLGYMIREKKRPDKYYTLYLLTLVGMQGIILTGDLFNMYVFLEILSISAYALVAFETERPEANEAAIKYLIVGSIASTFILLAVALIYGEFDTLTMAMAAKLINQYGVSKTLLVAYALYLTGFALKAGVAPMHMWLVDAHPSAPSPVSMLLSGVIIKTFIYSFLRITFSVFGLSHINAFAIGIWIIILGIASLLIGPFMAVTQRDIKRLLAFSTVTEVGYIYMGIGVCMVAYGSMAGTLAFDGALYHIMNHALYKGLLFLGAGAVILATGTRDLTRMSNVAYKMPITFTTMLIGALAITGLPPFNGFFSKWLMFEAFSKVNPFLGGLVFIASALTFVYMMKIVFSMYAPGEKPARKEARPTMVASMIVLAALCIALGLLASPLINHVIGPAVSSIMNRSAYINAVFHYQQCALNWSEVSLGW